MPYVTGFMKVTIWSNEVPPTGPPAYPDQGLPPVSPGYPDQGLPPVSGGGSPSHPIYLPGYPDQGLPPVSGGQPPYPDQGLPPGSPGAPDQGLPPLSPGSPAHPIVPPGSGNFPDNTLPGFQPHPDQGLPIQPPGMPPAVPQAFNVGDQPEGAPDEGGTWVVVVSGSQAAWAYVPAADEETEPPTDPAAPDQTLPEDLPEE